MKSPIRIKQSNERYSIFTGYTLPQYTYTGYETKRQSVITVEVGKCKLRVTEPIFWTGLALGSTLFCAGIVGLSRLLQ
ncbi:hypothetical protein CO165_01895 [Candidatus Roizmanbacteria bacterium CG_4_9_14_3_um_filter_33_18]|uniref:Uncharacterized protein n=3 Tax=Candidatus Roizmaniibacteriota TaxID=1752723 RepID=A0A2M7U6S6_9BACT|nr:MAG: hypothetical protein COW97_01620 [Candidatus Roizmanbacteria bacterium CG22_combo_CG10-13_8_21_14_all_34_12]PIZ66923.1 MAG: hypothetical protein COY12_02585 [Candidatus Roizmanbacteria bacterium CG_4_10_14_0_2_um_filter_33_96]PJA55767.1 MAG: hypothetical protein CO165_01895 [Candidatus Roizmanbacteria bacterium CG_4_9_14_3_um_filter_33_18]